MDLAQRDWGESRYTSRLVLPKCLWQHVDDLGLLAKGARVGRLCTCGHTGWAEAKHEGSASAWARGGRARAPSALALADDGQLRLHIAHVHAGG